MPTDLPLRLALATVPCPNDGRKLARSELNSAGVCALCDGNVLVPWLKGVRVTCDPEVCDHGILLEDDLPFARKGANHKPCQGRGWVVSEDTEAWWKAMHDLPDKAFQEALAVFRRYLWEKKPLKEALQRALEKVVPA